MPARDARNEAARVKVLVTGSAGFIGYHVSAALLARGQPVLGVDRLDSYYDPALKRARLARLRAFPGFAFEPVDVADRDAMIALGRQTRGTIRDVVHLAAQAGVRHSLEAPFDYAQSNLMGHMVMLELCREMLPGLRHLVYASSSSVYGGNRKLPFAVGDRVDQPLSLYAATKRADELLSHCYSHLYRLPATGLRFFTVYGPWGRPDMAAFRFADAITAGQPITLYNQGKMERDFTYIDDVVAGVLAALDRPPVAGNRAPHRLYNLGSHRPVELRHFVNVLERALGRRAEIRLAPLPPGDVVRTCADIAASRRDLGFEPKTPIEVGLPRFAAWYCDYRGLGDGAAPAPGSSPAEGVGGSGVGP
jgi:UDP-glucuronate 4-epimerase